ncbi:hypothetical protein HPB51_026810 [Rhipicephalus microplus]|uniref:Endonuclease/exonuclease/phosphatase domain-containing protein n=1 Tax=Rhipicephalus microplus TaxID=6941 RepID=A0A9J6D230_RHIMP|nr:hypothetical protein HPB51_026810 [Rhipicephalus microplus]
MKTLSNSKFPDAIALQEPFDRAQLPGYVACGYPCECTQKDIKVCTLVKRGTAFIDHSLDISEESDIDHNLVEVVPCIGNQNTGLFVLNVYSPPSKRGLTHNFGALFREAMAKAASNPLLICGDFNVPHMQWEYGADSPKGKRLAELMDELGLDLLNEPNVTRYFFQFANCYAASVTLPCTCQKAQARPLSAVPSDNGTDAVSVGVICMVPGVF